MHPETKMRIRAFYAFGVGGKPLFCNRTNSGTIPLMPQLVYFGTQKRSGLFVIEFADQRGNRLLGVTIDHNCVIIGKQRVFHAGETSALAAL